MKVPGSILKNFLDGNSCGTRATFTEEKDPYSKHKNRTYENYTQYIRKVGDRPNGR